jgi:hypothetical protein
MNISRDNIHGFVIGRAIVAAAVLASVVLPCGAESSKRWDFDKNNDREGWIVPANALGVVMGGSLWVALNPRETDPAKIASPAYQVLGDMFDGKNIVYDTGTEIVSPRGIDIATSEAQQVQVQVRVRVRVLNLSPATDLFLRWRTKEQTEGWGTIEKSAVIAVSQFLQSRHCALIPDLKKWQEITCYVDKQWRGVIDQIAIYIPKAIRGDIWIDSVDIAVGPTEPVHVRPDVASAAVVPKVAIPGISQPGFAEAFKALDKCLIVDVPLSGFTHPFMSAGGYHSRGGWFPLDTSLTVSGAKWVNQGFAEGVMQGFHDVQTESPDGRLDGWGNSTVHGQVGDVSQLPMFFEVAYDVARRTNDLQLRSEIYQTMRRYLDWWLSPVKRDGRTGLVSGVIDEAISDPEYGLGIVPQSVAPVDLNVAVAVGAARTADLAVSLGNAEDSKKYRQVFQDLSRAINSTLWDEHDGVYYNYDLRERRARKSLIVSTFDPLRLGIAPVARRERLLKRMLDPAQFNWSKVPLTTLAMTDPGYVEWKGDIVDTRAWFGDVWTERNLQIIAGLEESGRSDLAAELNWATIKAFHNNYREYLIPSTGEGQGANPYGWSASQYIAAIVEHLFGVDFDRIRKRLRIEPHVPQSLYGEEIAIDNLILPSEGDTRLSVRIKQSAMGFAKVAVNISGPLPAESLEIALPGSAKKILVPTPHSMTAIFP